MCIFQNPRFRQINQMSYINLKDSPENNKLKDIIIDMSRKKWKDISRKK